MFSQFKGVVRKAQRLEEVRVSGPKIVSLKKEKKEEIEEEEKDVEKPEVVKEKSKSEFLS